jgi:Raf kinase inhibitor-like YbhB/YbcL family protein
VTDTDFTLSSPEFADGQPIPRRFTCDGEDVSPPLAWEGVPDGAAALALVLDDPDAGGGTYVHWVVHGLEPTLTGLDEGALPDGAREAENADGESGYSGPCPPEEDGPHTYRFTVYALDEQLDADDGAGQADVLGDIRDHAVAKGTLEATFDH